MMGVPLVRFRVNKDGRRGWGVLNDSCVTPLNLEVDHHKDVMALYFEQPEVFQAAYGKPDLALADLTFESPLNKRIQMFAQGLNYASHRAEGGMKTEEQEQNLVFYKAASSLCGPNDDIIRPLDCELLDYEIELGLVLKKDIECLTTVTEQNLPDYIGALFLCNDVSSRDHQFGAPVIQWFKGKSFRTFCPAGPVLYLMDHADFAELYDLELVLKVNGEIRQQTKTDLLIHKPPKTLTDISEYADLYAGDCILTGTPGGVIAGMNAKSALAILLNFKNDKKRRQKFVAAQKARARFLAPGDILELSIRSISGAIDLGAQRNRISEPA